MTPLNHTVINPIQRLLDLEKIVHSLVKNNLTSDPPKIQEQKHIWMGGEHLLLRSLKRNPIVLSAYRVPAEINIDRRRNVELIRSKNNRGLELIELDSGDAILMTDQTRFEPSASILSAVFEAPSGAGKFPESSEIIRLPYFMPIERGRRWSMFSRGLLVACKDTASPMTSQSIREQQQDIFKKELGAELHSQRAEILTLKSEISSLKRLIRHLKSIEA